MGFLIGSEVQAEVYGKVLSKIRDDSHSRLMLEFNKQYFTPDLQAEFTRALFDFVVYSP